jgi:hypothetical protein
MVMAQIHIAKVPNHLQSSDLEQKRFNHTGNQWTKFIRTRDEIEHILGIRYDKIKHCYVYPLDGIDGLEVLFMRGNILDGGNPKGLGKTAYAVYPILLPYKEGENPLITSDFLPDRYVILKSAIEDYLIHTDDELHLRGNTNRAYALEFFLGKDKEGIYKVIMQQVDTNITYFPCAEGNTPIELP